MVNRIVGGWSHRLVQTDRQGTGIYTSPSMVLNGAQSVGAAMCLWLFGTILAFSGLFVYIEWGLTIPRYHLNRNTWVSAPRSGGEKNYVSRRYAKPADREARISL